MINVADITSGVITQLSNDVDVAAVFKFIERAEYINTDPSRTPWCGVYRQQLTFDPRTLGRGAQNWLAQVHLDIVVQAHADGGLKAEDALGDALQRVLAALINDLTFGGTVEMIKQYSVEFDYQRTDSATLDFQQAIISLQAEVRA